jgi:hypothetical protein
MDRSRIVVSLLVAATLAAACSTSTTPSPADRAAALKGLRDGIHPLVSVKGYSLVATTAVAFTPAPSGGSEPTFVRVRIIDRLDVEVRVETDDDVWLAADPRICLVGPYAAPDDAGLEDRCWGEPDLAATLVAQMARDAEGHPGLRAGSPLVVRTTIERGDTRCDYPAGTWHLEVKIDPLVEGAATGADYLPDTQFEVPFAHSEALPFFPSAETRYCGLATLVVRDQGEPTVQTP